MIAVSDSSHYKFYENLRQKASNEYFFIVMTYNFIDAKEKLFEYVPDYVIMDYYLENGTAIQILKLISESHLATRAIILHDNLDYEFVRLSFLHGVLDYLPFANFDVEKFLTQESRQDKTHQEIDSARLRLQSYLGLVKDQQSINRNILFQLLDLNHVIFDFSKLFIYFRIDCIHEVYANMKQERNQLQKKLREIIQSEFIKVPQILFSKNHSGIILSNARIYDECKEILNNIILKVEQQLNFSISFTLTKPVCDQLFDDDSNKELFLKIYVELTQHQDDKFYLKKASVINEYSLFTSLSALNPFYQKKRFTTIKDINQDNLNSFLETTLNYFYQHKVNPVDVRNFYNYILTKIQIIIQDKIINSTFSCQQFQLQIQFCEFYEDLKRILRQWENVLLKMIHHQAVGYSAHTQAIMKMIEDDPQNKFTLEDFSNKLNLTPIYISRLFKKETGVSLFNYINDIKMKQAAELLVNSKILIKDISLKLGFQNQFYFNKVFQKYYQVNPSEYRRRESSKIV